MSATTTLSNRSIIAVFPFALLAGLLGCGSGAGAPAPEWRDPVTGMEFVLVRPARFEMGLRHPPGDVRPAPPHTVTISKSFYIGRYEVTQREWSEVMGNNPSRFADCGPSCPVESVSWHDVQEFLARMSRPSDGERFRLPTEAEWELACLAGADGRYTDGMDRLTPDVANYNPGIAFEGVAAPGFRAGPTPVGTFPPNALGLHDIHGNVWEWTQDEYCPYALDPVTDPRGACGTDTIPIRGGSWLFSANAARCARRYTHARHDSGYGLGFRVVREVKGS